CIGLSGVECWSKPREDGPDGKKIGPRELIDDLATLPWRGQRVCTVFDSDIVENEGVAWAEFNFSEALAKLGLEARNRRLPSAPSGEKVGLDDYLLTHSADELRQLLAAAGRAGRPTRRGQSLPFDAAAKGEGVHLTDYGNAQRLVERHGQDLRYCH